MSSAVAEWFGRSEDVQAFGAVLRQSEGAFSLEAPDLMELGEAVLRKYPAASPEGARLAYAVFRLCVTEHLLAPVGPSAKEAFRSLLHRPAGSADRQTVGAEAESMLPALEERLGHLTAVISSLPGGLVKERLSGAVALFHNQLHLLRRQGRATP